MGLGVYGKHPAKGDFLDHGLPSGILRALEGWLDQALGECRASLGGDWERLWQDAPVLRFWLGEGIWGQAVCGVMATSRDRVGRRFPLMLIALGEVPPPPVIDPGQGWYDRAEAHLRAALGWRDLPSVPALVAGLGMPGPSGYGVTAGDADFWAARPGAGVADLLADIALTDHRRAAADRGYWWVAGEDEAAAAGWPQEAPSDVVAEADGPDAAATAPEAPAEGDAPEAAAADAAETPVAEAAAVAEDDATEAAEEGPPAPPAAVDPPAPEADPWAAAWDSLPEEEAASPFDSPAGGLGLFAPPEAPVAGSVPVAASATAAGPQVAAPTRRAAAWSRVQAGPGLPGGQVLAWFLRGNDGSG